jgi:putative PIN family toxin of toxin-antitoxin system
LGLPAFLGVIRWPVSCSISSLKQLPLSDKIPGALHQSVPDPDKAGFKHHLQLSQIIQKLVIWLHMCHLIVMKKIVVDTSIFISALIGSKGPSRELLRQCLRGRYQPLISNALFLEYEDVSSRANIQKLCPLSHQEINELLKAFYSVCHWVSIHYLWRPNLRDENDNFLVELAVAGNAQMIVTNNIKDLTNAQLSFDSFEVCQPQQLLRSH